MSFLKLKVEKINEWELENYRECSHGINVIRAESMRELVKNCEQLAFTAESAINMIEVGNQEGAIELLKFIASLERKTAEELSRVAEGGENYETVTR